VVLCRFDGERITTSDISHFELPYRKTSSLLLIEGKQLYQSLQTSLQQGAEAADGPIASIAVDTMGTSFALLDEHDALTEEVISGRVPQEKAILQSVFDRIPAREAYRITGLQPKKLNSLFLLAKFQRERPDLLESTRTFLMLPDLITFWLTGVKACELTEAGTSWLLDIHARAWSERLLTAMELPTDWFPPIVRPGTVLGPLLPSMGEQTNLRETKVIAGPSHDTASAFAAVQDYYQRGQDQVGGQGPRKQAGPSDREGWILSCGTWSIFGSLEDTPIVSEEAFDANCANEPAYDEKIMFVQNSVNLWIWEEFYKQLRAQGYSYTHGKLNQLAGEAQPEIASFDPMAPEFLLSTDMIGTIQACCQNKGSRVPETHGEIARVILESLVANYRRQYERHVAIQGQAPSLLHLIGGGSRNPLLCQWTANSLGLPVKAGPGNATALGNSLVQLAALGEMGTRDFHHIVEKSSSITYYRP
jgi:rhamnulokinase